MLQRQLQYETTTFKKRVQPALSCFKQEYQPKKGNIYEKKRFSKKGWLLKKIYAIDSGNLFRSTIVTVQDGNKR